METGTLSCRAVMIGIITTFVIVLSGPLILWHFLRRDRAAILESVGFFLARLAEAVGPSAIKLGQIASYRQDLIPLELAKPLGRLQDQVTLLSPRVVQRVLKRAYGEEMPEIFEHVDYKPFAGGSVAVVVRGRTLGGEEVAIKLVRPGVKRQIEIDLKIMRFIVRIAAKYMCRFDGLPILEVFDHFSELIVRQCDMDLEARSAERLRNLLDSEIIIPRPLIGLTRPAVLVTALISGTSKFDSVDIPTKTYKQASQSLLRSVYSMIFVHGFVHGDLHPGNVAINSSGQVVLYDFGLVTELRHSDRLLFTEFMLAVAVADSATTAKKIIQSSKNPPIDLDIAEFETAVGRLLQVFSCQKAGQFLVVQFVGELFMLQRRFGLSGTPGFSGAVWALAMFEGLVRKNYPELDFQAEASRFIAGLLVSGRDATT